MAQATIVSTIDDNSSGIFYPELSQQAGVAHQDTRSIHSGLQSVAGNLRNVRCGNQLYISLFGIAYDGFGYGVRTVSLCRGGKLYQLLFRNSRLCLAGLYIEVPLVSVPVLSNTTVLTWVMASR